MTFYTYVHFRADDGRAFYVGKGKGARAFSDKGRNAHWRRTAAKHGVRAEIATRWPTEQDAFDHERFLIACFRDMGHPLTNKTDGGEGASGVSPTKETRAKLAAASRGRRLSEATRARMSEKRRGQPPAEHVLRASADLRRGKPMPREVAEKIAASHRGRKRSDEARRNMSLARIGKQLPPEAVAKVAAANRGRKRSDEFKAKVSAGLKGRAVSEETRAKISAALKRHQQLKRGA